MKAFLKVGKQVSFPLDLPLYLPPLNRTEASVAEAEAKLTLPKDQIAYAQFWFVKATPLDEIAFKNLQAGDISKAEDIWRKKECASSLQNLIVCALISGKYDSAISHAETLYGNAQHVAQFADSINGTGASTDAESLAFSFLDTLCGEVRANTLLPFVTNSEWKSHIGEKSVKPLIESIQAAIDTAKKSKKEGPEARLEAGETLMESTKSTLSLLKEFLPKTDLRYQMTADKLGLEILQCGIDYYNGSEEEEAARKAMRLQKYAQKIVVGQMAKDRCRENVDILQENINNRPPSEVSTEVIAITEELSKYRTLPDKICHAVALLEKTKPHLLGIKRKLGATNAYYLKISTLVVNNALSNVIAEVNKAQSTDKGLHFASKEAFLLLVEPVIRKAWEAIKIMDGFDMESDFKHNRYNTNRSTLKDMCNSLVIPTRGTPVRIPKTKERRPNRGNREDEITFFLILMRFIGILLGAGFGDAIGDSFGAVIGGIVGFLIGTKIADYITN